MNATNEIGWRLPKWLLMLSLAGMAIFTVFLWSHLTSVYVAVDPYVFATAAKRMLAGERLYVDFFESKPPLMTLTYALPGLVSPGLARGLGGVTVLLVVCLLIQAGMWFWYLRPSHCAVLASLLFVVIFPATYWDFAWASSEHFSNVVITWILIVSWISYRDRVMLSARRSFWIGMATCIAFHFRQNCLLVALVPLGVLFLDENPFRQKLSRFAWFVAGGVAAWAMILGVVSLVSDVPAYFYQVFVFPGKFASYNGGPGMRTAAILDFLTVSNESGFIFIVAAGVGLALLGKARGFVLLSLIAGMTYCIISPRSHHHYLINLFPFIMLCILIGLDGSGARMRLKEGFLLGLVLLVIAMRLCIHPWWENRPRLQDMDEVVAAVNRMSAKGDTLYVGGLHKSGYILLKADPLPANKYAFGWEIDSNAGMMQESSAAILESFTKKPPTLLVIDRSLMNVLTSSLEDRIDSAKYFDRLAKFIYGTVPGANADTLECVKLVRLLRTNHSYVESWRNEEFHVLKLEKRP